VSLPLPEGPLTMAALLQLEPLHLRRLLKAGLRRGASAEQLDAILMEGWGWSLHSGEGQSLLQALASRGWFKSDGAVWKTYFV